MYSEARKLHLIEELLKVNNDRTLSELETVLDKARNAREVSTSIKDFSGIWSKDEADEIEKIIAESCETINPDDWK